MCPTDDHSDSAADDCPVTLEDLIALRDGDLDHDQARRLRERIERDPDTAAGLLDELDQTDGILERLRNQPPPPELSDRLQSAIADEAARGAGDDQQNGAQEDDDTER